MKLGEKFIGLTVEPARELMTLEGKLQRLLCQRQEQRQSYSSCCFVRLLARGVSVFVLWYSYSE
jgi:hypothetical protein